MSQHFRLLRLSVPTVHSCLTAITSTALIIIQVNLLTPRLVQESIIFLSLTLSVCMCVCHGAPSNCLFFVSRWNRAIFWPSVLHVALYKTVFFDFWFRPLNPKIYSPKFGTKSPISQIVWQIDRKCLCLLGGFRGWPIQWNHAKCFEADPCCHGNDICARRRV